MRLTEAQLRDELRKRIDAAGTQTNLARELQLSTPYLSDIVNNRAPVSDRVASALGFDRIVEYEPKRIVRIVSDTSSWDGVNP
jgi:hypothetical protein